MGWSVPDPYAALDGARDVYDASCDLTVGVEEELQILDPESLTRTNRYPELHAALEAGGLAEHTAGELIASEIEVKTGRCERFTDAVDLVVERRRQLFAEADRVGVGLAASG